MNRLNRTFHVLTKAWEYSLRMLAHPLGIPSVLYHVLGGAHLGTILWLSNSWLQHAGIDTVIDVGAHRGEFATSIRALLPRAAIYSFEPLPECFAALQSKMSTRNPAKQFNTALGDESGEITFHRSSFTKSSSVLPMAALHKSEFPWSAGATALTVKLSTLDDFMDEMTITPQTLLKIDVQGFEDRVLRGAKQTLSQVKYVMVETSFRELYEGQSTFQTIYALLTEAGFSYAGNADQLLSPKDGTILQADALFVR